MHAVASDTQGRTQTLVNSEEKKRRKIVCPPPPPHSIDITTCSIKTDVLMQPVSALVPVDFCVVAISFLFLTSFFFPQRHQKDFKCDFRYNNNTINGRNIDK